MVLHLIAAQFVVVGCVDVAWLSTFSVHKKAILKLRSF